MLDACDQLSEIECLPDIILWTGDSSPHGLLDITKEDIVSTMETTARLILNAFQEVPQVIVSLGNHEFEPVNYQSFDEPKQEHLAQLANAWHHAMSPAAKKSFLEYGFYSEVFR